MSDKQLADWRNQNVGFVFQHYALFPHLTAFENIAFGLRVRPRASRPDEAAIRARVEELLALVQIEDLGHRFPGQLSGGQRQRVALARALAIDPAVLLLDEPFGALDALTRAHLQDELLKIVAKTGTTVLMVTHDVDEAVLLSDRIVMMTNGPAATVGEIVDVDLARPRERLALVNDQRYHQLRGRVLEFLYQKQLRPAA